MDHERMLRCLTNCNQSLVRIASEHELLNRICEIIVQDGGYKYAWIGMKGSSSTKDVIPVATYGIGDDYLKAVKIRWDESEYGGGPTGTAIRTGETIINHSTVSDRNYQPWRDKALQYDYRSSIAIPVKLQNEVYGALNIYSDSEGVFIPEEVELLEELALDLAYGIVNIRNRNELDAANAQLVKQYTRLKLIYENITDGIFVADMQGNYLYANPAGLHMVGYTLAELREKRLEDLLVPQETSAKPIQYEPMYKGELPQVIRTFVRKDGSTFAALVKGRQLPDGHLLGIVHNVDNTIKEQNHLKELAFKDGQTGLPNKNYFFASLEQYLKQQQSEPRRTLIAVLNIDNFNRIQDGYGRLAGTKIIESAAATLRETVASDDLWAYAGGDEFYLLLSDGPNSAEEKLRALTSLISQKYDVGSLHVSLSVGVGYAVFPEHGLSPQTLIDKAYAAMHKAKELGRGQIYAFDSQLKESALSRLTLEHDLGYALQQGNFVLYYQPQKNIESNQVQGVEALIRWKRGNLGMQSPADFIPFAEESGLIHPIGVWVLNEVGKQISSGAIPAGIKVSVNLSPLQFHHPGFLEAVDFILMEYELPGDRLTFELTEGAIFREIDESMDLLAALRERGIGISVDDFGTGYSSLAYLLKLPIDEIKIDRSFIQGLKENRRAQSLVSTILSLGSKLEMRVVIEGVEDGETLEVLRGLEGKIVQGYFTGRPMPVENLPWNA